MIEVPKQLANFVDRFMGEYGVRMYFVGGFVRDTLLGKSPNDVDLTTAARPEQVKRMLNQLLEELHIEAVYTVGEEYGTIGAKIPGYDIEITTYRSEQYEDGNRKPDVTYGMNMEADLSRRDFTINAMAANVIGRVYDPHDGQEDLKNHLVRFVGHPKVRIMEDALRMLRAVRFAVQLDFDLDREARYWITAQSYMIGNISNERIRDELSKILLSDNPARGVRLLRELGLLNLILPEIDRLSVVQQVSPYHEDDVFVHTMKVLHETPPVLELRLAALFHDAGKHLTQKWAEGRTTFYGHEYASHDIARSALRRLRFENDVVYKVCHMVGVHMRPLSLYTLLDKGEMPTRKAVRRFMREVSENDTTVDELMTLNHADMLAHKNPIMGDWYVLQGLIRKERESEEVQPEEAVSPLDGYEIQTAAEHFEQGPWIGRTKEYLTDLVISGIMDVDDKDAARGEVRRYWNV